MAKVATLIITGDGEREKHISTQVVGDNTNMISELLCELNIIDDFNEQMQEKIVELAMGIVSHDGDLVIV